MKTKATVYCMATLDDNNVVLGEENGMIELVDT